MKGNKEKKLEETILDLEQYVQMMGEDVFNVTIINSLKDYRAYVNERRKKDDELNRYYSEFYSLSYDKVGIVCESFPEIGTRKRRSPSLSLNTILEYVDELDSHEDVKTIKLMLYNLLANRCTDEELMKIREAGNAQRRMPMIAHADQVVVGNKGKTIYYGYGKEKQ